MSVSGRAPSGASGDRWIPWTIVGFFVAIALTDGIFVALALSSSTGLDIEQAYAQGLAHDQALAARRAQDLRGWRSRLSVQAGGDSVGVEARVDDHAGRGLTGAEVSARFRRPTQAGLDFDLPLTESAPGRYQGRAPLPAPGQWDIELHVRHAAGDYLARERVVLR